ncbi:WD40 repeat-like protein [Artomyces pyxidatus]|uniref:WD40 repeat-like protein n=1 Tax=Artomyces pyxidatus TaxID=48021 RepID=A0ACB8T3T5_9AGAM|nr:WD40 repeat-like protein [Artomyces pyxidatus]
MRIPESDRDDDFSGSPDHPQAGPSSMSTAPKSNGHVVNGSSNGFSIPATNGVRKHSKSPVSRVPLPGTTLYDDSYIDREEFIRLVIQSLRDVGYVESAATLEAESGYVMETPQVAEFRQCVLEGAWTDAEAALMHLGVRDDDGLWEAKFLISQQKYLEYLEAGRTTAALHVLRNELAPLHMDPEQLHPLSSLVMCADATDLKQRAGWDGALGSSRRRLLVNLQSYIPSSLMIPPRRFSTLLDQARLHQRSQCLYHNAPPMSRHFSLYSDHFCDRDMFPRTTTAILEVHTDEVWNMEWSHNGRYLATASKDKSVIIWSIETDPPEISPESVLRDHPFPVGCLAWSLDDAILLSSSEQYIKMWNTQTGVCIRTIEAHTETVSALAWVPDGSGFISGSQDRKITLWGYDGKQRDSWGITAIRITDLAVTPDFTRLVAVGESAAGTAPSIATSPARGDSATPPVAGSRTNAQPANPPGADNHMIVYNLATKQPEISVALEGQLTSVKISEDSQYALINHAPDEILLWDISTGQMTRKYTGQRQGRHIIRSCFGGVDGNFVVSGSEDGNVYVWHRDRGILLEVLSGHGSGSVNSVAWNPRNKQMFASCSDDFTIRLWEAPYAGDALSQASSSRTARDQGQEPEVGGKGKGKSREPWTDDGADGFGSRSTSL